MDSSYLSDGEFSLLSRTFYIFGELKNSPEVSRITPRGELIKIVQYVGVEEVKMCVLCGLHVLLSDA